MALRAGALLVTAGCATTMPNVNAGFEQYHLGYDTAVDPGLLIPRRTT